MDVFIRDHDSDGITLPAVGTSKVKIALPGNLRTAFSTGVARVEEWLGGRFAGRVLLGLVAWVYTTAYLHHPLWPGHSPPEMRQGWWSWADQFVYWRSAAELAQFHLTPANYHFPLGYPMLGALFCRLMPAHAFFVPDLLLVLGAAWVWWRLARRWLSRLETLLTGVAFVSLHREVLALTLVVPWNTIATQLTLLAGIWVMVATQGPRTVWRLTGLAMLTYLLRPGDAACFAPMLIWAVVRLPLWRERLVCALGGMVALGVTMAVVGLVNHAVFGTWDTAYERTTWQGIGFFSYPPVSKVFWLFVDGRPFFGEGDTALLFRYPWLFLVVPGVIYWVRTSGMAAAAALATLGLNWALYLNYNDFLPSAVFRYSLIHYLAWGLAPLFALSIAGLLHGWREPVTWAVLVGTCGLALAALSLQMEARELPAVVSPGQVDRLPATRPLWVRFPDTPLEKVTMLRLDGRPMQEAADYQIPYVPADLRLLLSSRAKGTTLSAPTAAGIKATPVVGDYVWRWRFDARRLWPGSE